MSTKELQIAERARKFKGEALTNLQQFIDEEMLVECYNSLNKKSSKGVDGETWHDYEYEKRIPKLLSEFKSGRYKAPPIRRVYIPKDKDGKRPLGIPTIEDKILQASVRKTLDPIYEEDFKDFSYGFRKGRSPHQAIDYMFKEVSFKKMHYIIDADIKDYFGSIDHGILRNFLNHRVRDGVIRKMLNKWLKAGILEDKQLSYPKKGTPQGGVISPLISNIYLHYVLDEWFVDEVQPRLRGKSSIVRYADDFVLIFENMADVERVMEVLPKRFKKYNLELHPLKTKIIDLNNKGEKSKRGFEFLGFTHYLGKSRKGKSILKRKTSKNKFTLALNKMRKWIKENRHRKIKEIIDELNVKLRGYYNYYGITFNSLGVNRYFQEVRRILYKWINRRGGKSVWRWKRFEMLIDAWIPIIKPRVYHSYQKAKPI